MISGQTFYRILAKRTFNISHVRLGCQMCDKKPAKPFSQTSQIYCELPNSTINFQSFYETWLQLGLNNNNNTNKIIINN